MQHFPASWLVRRAGARWGRLLIRSVRRRLPTVTRVTGMSSSARSRSSPRRSCQISRSRRQVTTMTSSAPERAKLILERRRRVGIADLAAREDAVLPSARQRPSSRKPRVRRAGLAAAADGASVGTDVPAASVGSRRPANQPARDPCRPTPQRFALRLWSRNNSTRARRSVASAVVAGDSHRPAPLARLASGRTWLRTVCRRSGLGSVGIFSPEAVRRWLHRAPPRHEVGCPQSRAAPSAIASSPNAAVSACETLGREPQQRRSGHEHGRAGVQAWATD